MPGGGAGKWPPERVDNVSNNTVATPRSGVPAVVSSAIQYGDVAIKRMPRNEHQLCIEEYPRYHDFPFNSILYGNMARIQCSSLNREAFVHASFSDKDHTKCESKALETLSKGPKERPMSSSVLFQSAWRTHIVLYLVEQQLFFDVRAFPCVHKQYSADISLRISHTSHHR